MLTIGVAFTSFLMIFDTGHGAYGAGFIVGFRPAKLLFLKPAIATLKLLMIKKEPSSDPA